MIEMMHIVDHFFMASFFCLLTRHHPRIAFIQHFFELSRMFDALLTIESHLVDTLFRLQLLIIQRKSVTKS